MKRRSVKVTRSKTAAIHSSKDGKGDGSSVKNMPEGCKEPQCSFDKVKSKTKSNTMEDEESSKLSEKYCTQESGEKSKDGQNKESSSIIKPFSGYVETPVNTLKSMKRLENPMVGFKAVRKRLFSEKDDSEQSEDLIDPKRVKGGILADIRSSDTSSMTRDSSVIREMGIEEALQKVFPNANLIGDFSARFILPLAVGEHADLKSISRYTLARLIESYYDGVVGHYTIVDCRYPYEYEGGHIKGAINIYTTEQIKEMLTNHSAATTSSCVPVSPGNFAGKRDVLIFYSEFSSKRGPILSRTFRNLDRTKNILQCPKLDFPEMYLLLGGYNEFYEAYEELCEPPGYIKMSHLAHSEEFKRIRIDEGLSSVKNKNETENA